jgi:outer membrane protein TolC
MTRLRTGALIVTTICSNLLGVASAAAEPGDSVTELALIRAFLEQPAQAATETAGAHRVDAASATEPWTLDPSVELRHEQGLTPGSTFRTTAVGGSIALDVSGQRQLQRRAGARRAAGIEAEIDGDRRAAVCEVRWTILGASQARDRLVILQRRHDQLASLVEIVAGLVAAGEVSGYDEDRLRLQLSTHALDLSLASSEWKTSRITLQHRTGLRFDRIDLGTALPLPDLQILTGTAMANHPRLQTAQEFEAAAGLDERAAMRTVVPGFGLYGAYRVDSEADTAPGSGIEAGLSVDLPWPGEGRREREQARAEQAVQEATSARLTNELLYALEAAHERATAASRALDDAAPDLDRMWDATWARYQAGEATVTELVDSLMSIEEQELAVLTRAYSARGAGLDLACTAGVFTEPQIEGLFEESTR